MSSAITSRMSLAVLLLQLSSAWLSSISAQSITFTQQTLADSFSSFGCSVVDYDGDGWDDIFVGGWYSTALFHNEQNGTFTERSKNAGVKLSGRYVCGIWGDVNNDGFPDLFLGARDSVGSNALFINNGNGTFYNSILSSGISRSASIGSAAFGDFNNDGLVDLFLAVGTGRPGSYDLLYENHSSGDTILFTDVSSAAGIGGNPNTFAMQATWIDYNHDGYLDLFCVHDGYAVNRLYHNMGGFPFPDVASSAKLSWYGFANSMGIAWCDYNNDGWEDVYVTNIDTGGFYKNNGDGTFTDITRTCGAAFNGMSWGVVFPDLDNDGDEDCFIANMYGFDSRPSLLYENVNGAFQNISAQANAALTCGSYGCASGDFNNDGYEDILVTNFNNPPGQNILLMNSRTKTGHWMKLKLQGTTINRMAIGTKVRVVAGGKSQIRIVDGGSSYCSQISPTLHFGLANSTIIDTIEIFWRQGYTQRFTHLMADTTYSITEGLIQTAVVDEPANMRRPRTETLFQNYPNPFNPETHFRFQISNAGFVSLKLFDLLGREVETVVSEELPAGLFTRTWDAGEVSCGVYYAKLFVVDARGQLITQNVRKVIVMK